MTKTNDPFEEFEFKPLTEGLGFHKKVVQLKEEVAVSGLAASGQFNSARRTDLPDLTDLLFDDAEIVPEKPMRVASQPIRETVELPRVEIKKPLPRDLPREQPSSPITKIEPQLNLQFKESDLKTPNLDKAILGVVEENAYQPIATALFAALFDGVVALTLSILFLVAMMMVIEVDLMAMLLNAETQFFAQMSFAFLYFAILQLYMVVTRSIAHSTVGEWAFDVHLAQRNGETSTMFPLRVVWRSMVMVATGMIVLPLLSLIFRRDLAAYLTGTQLFQLK